MKALILAAGRGERMGELTKTLPKPLLRIRGKTLIEHRIHALAQAGFHDIVINLFYLGDHISRFLGDGSGYGVKIQYSWEEEKLDVGGGIQHALPLLGNKPFLITSADIDSDYPYEQLRKPLDKLAHLVLTDNPPFHPDGDFNLAQGLISFSNIGKRLTYMSIAVFHPDLFLDLTPGRHSFLDCLTPSILQQQVSGEYFSGRWINVDNAQRLALAEQA